MLAAIAGALLTLSLAGCSAGAEAQDYGLKNAYMPEEGVLFGGQPTSDQLRQLAAAGFEVINLRMPSEDHGFDESALARELGLVYHSIPVGSETLTEAGTFQTFLDRFESRQGPVVVHCASGNRVGAMYYAYLVERGGLSREQALKVARDNGLSSESLIDAVNRYLDREP